MLSMMDTKVYEQKKNSLAEVGEVIGYEKGAKMIKNHFDRNKETVASFIGRNTIEDILSQPGVVGITMFSGIDQNGDPKPVLVGVDSEGNYILNVATVGANGELTKQKGIVATGVLSPGNADPTQSCGWW